MMAVDINKGATAWIQNFSSSETVSAPTGVGKTAFAMLQGSIAAVDVDSGNILWTCSSGCCAQALGGGALAVGSTLFFGGAGPSLMALDINSQKCLWSTPLATNGALWPRDILATVAGGTIVAVESGTSGAYGINAKTGAVLWKRTDLPQCMGDSNYCHPDMSSNDVVYFPSGTTIIGLEASTGHVTANFSVPAAVYGSPSTGMSLLVVSTQSAVYAYQEASGANVNNCGTASCTVCVPNTLQLGCAKLSAGGSLYRQCTFSGLEVTAFTSSDCTGTPITSDEYNTGVCYPTPFGTSFEVLSCPTS
jgi:outer membrane protein assembly factor BamB